MSRITHEEPAAGGHPDRFVLEQHVVGELGGAALEELEEHLEGCTRCRERHWRVQQEQAMARRAMPETAPVAAYRVRERRDRVRAAGWVTAAAGWAAAACVLLVWSPWGGGPAAADPSGGDAAVAATRAKGAFGVSVLRGRGETVDRLGSVAVCRAGDRLQFEPDVPDHGYLQIVNVQDDGQIQAYLPATPVDQARARLGFSVELDDYRGRERIFFVWSPEPLRAAAVREGVLEQLQRHPIEEVEAVPLPAELGAEQRSLLIYKEATP